MHPALLSGKIVEPMRNDHAMGQAGKIVIKRLEGLLAVDLAIPIERSQVCFLFGIHAQDRVASCETLLDETILWSMQESVRIAQGREDGNGQASQELVHNGASPVLQLAAGSPLATGQDQDPLVQQPQLAWIVRQYCREDRATMEAVCRHFGVQQVEQLRMSHFRELVNQKQQHEQR